MRRPRHAAWLSVVLAALVASLGACGGGLAAAPPPVAEPAASSDAPTPTWTLAPDVELGTVTRAAAPDGDSWIAARGRVRLRVDADGSVTEGAVAFEHELFGIAHVDDAWLFVTSVGEVFTAADPLGTPRPVSALDGAGLGFVVGRRHRLAVIDGRGALWVGDGHGMTRAPSEVPIVDASFATPSFGVRIALSGRLARTSDGGATWTELATPDGVHPYEVTDTGDAILVRAAPREQRFLVHATGEVEAIAAEPSLDHPVLPAAAAEAIAAHEEVPHQHRLAAQPTPSGRALLFAGRHELRRTPDGATTQVPPDCVPEIDTVGERFLMRCEGLNLVSDGASEWVPLGPRGELVVGDDLSVYVLRGTCASHRAPSGNGEGDDGEPEGGEVLERPDVVCVHDVHGERDVEFETEVRPVALVGNRLVLDEGGAIPVVVELDAGDARTAVDVFEGAPASSIVATGPGGAMALEAPAQQADGPHRARGVHRGEARRFAMGTLGAMHELVLPEHAWNLWPLDARHAIAGGAPDAAWITSDGGASFARVGTPSGFVIPHVADRPTPQLEARCGPVSCSFWDWSWSSVPLDDVLPPLARIEGAGADASRRERPAFVEIECDLASADAPDADEALLVASSGWLSLRAAAGARWTGGRVAGRIGGIDVEGRPFTASLRGGSVADFALAHGEEVRIDILAVTPAQAVLRRCDGYGDDASCDLVSLGTHRAPVVSGRLDTLADTFHASSTILGVLPRSDGGVVVHVSSADRTRVPPTDVVLEIAPDGTLTPHLLLVGWAPSYRALARDATGALGVLLVRGDEARFVGLDGTVGPARPAPPPVLDRVCGDRASDDLDFVAPIGLGLAQVLLLRPDGTMESSANAPVLATLATDGSACIREVHTRGTGGPLPGALSAQAEHGALVPHVAAPRRAATPITSCRPHEL